MILTLNSAMVAKEITKIRTTLTGRVERIHLNGQAKCGGVVVRARRMLWDANLRSISPRTTRMKTKTVLLMTKTLPNSFVVCAAKS